MDVTLDSMRPRCKQERPRCCDKVLLEVPDPSISGLGVRVLHAWFDQLNLCGQSLHHLIMGHLHDWEVAKHRVQEKIPSRDVFWCY